MLLQWNLPKLDTFGSWKRCPTYRGDDKIFRLIKNAYAYILNNVYTAYLKTKIN